jgi:hypothetical protein
MSNYRVSQFRALIMHIRQLHAHAEAFEKGLARCCGGLPMASILECFGREAGRLAARVLELARQIGPGMTRLHLKCRPHQPQALSQEHRGFPGQL